MSETDNALIRREVIEHLRLAMANGYVDSNDKVLNSPRYGKVFIWGQQGIWNPKQITDEVLSLRHSLAGGYEDELVGDRVVYDFLKPAKVKPEDYHKLRANQLLKKAYEQRTPCIYLHQIMDKPRSCYDASIAHILEWNPRTHSCLLELQEFDAISSTWEFTAESEEDERTYNHQKVKVRIHQEKFRQQLLLAYGGRCAITGLPEVRLLDAAHIVPDSNKELGQPVVKNGLLLSKIHHSAYDANLIGIRPDYRVEVSERLKKIKDGPQLEVLKGIDGSRLRMPSSKACRPDKNRLELRYQEFRETSG